MTVWNWRWLLACLVVVFWLQAGRAAETTLPSGSAPLPVALPYFPDAMHALVWRNWHAVPPERIAAVLGTSVENVAAVAESMGLPPAIPIPPEQRTRGYITVLRRNWHLLPYDQLLTLLDMSSEELAYSLREDDFLWVKLGGLKPRCAPVRYEPPGAEARRRASEIRAVVRSEFGEQMARQAEPRFEFVRRLSRPRPGGVRRDRPAKSLFALRYVYSYFALFGDPLMRPELDPYPDGLLQRLAEVGVDGVWLHVVLRNLAPGSPAFPEFGADHEIRLANLRQLVERAKRYRIGVYLYLNEPRAMPAAFFDGRPEMAGVPEGDHVAMCTSHPAVRAWIGDALTHVFTEVPDLAGVFTITASENLTNCASHGRWQQCPHCRDRSDAEIIAEVNAVIEAGVHRGNPQAKVIAWDWGWRGHGDAREIIARLPKQVWLMSVSEWSLPLRRGGVATTVGEYSISAVGPGPRATRHWSLARQAGLKTAAKVQLNNTWELSAVPYLPVMDLVAEHCHNLASAGVDGMMLSWSLGGYPSPNLEIAHRFSQTPTPGIDEVLDAVARERFGPEGASHARRAWTAMSDAFRQYPYGGGVLYRCPVQLGPSNLLHRRPTGYASTMVGLPYDDLDGWRGPYPAEVFAGQFEKVAAGWQGGIEELRAAVKKTPPELREAAEGELRVARAARLHFRSVANQARFVLHRNALAAGDRTMATPERRRHMEALRRVVEDEVALARELFTLTRQDSRIGFEASNQYYYLPLDLVEKVVNCRWVLDSYAAAEE
ncbi:MAG: hypothetical protein JXB62_11670 [Pirellulales bacterium]|nr:hypothetical protein [Pirellulales bacterium]